MKYLTSIIENYLPIDKTKLLLEISVKKFSNDASNPYLCELGEKLKCLLNILFNSLREDGGIYYILPDIIYPTKVPENFNKILL